MDFGEAAPGLLAPERDPYGRLRYVGHYQVSSANFGYHREQVARWVDDALGDARGWGRAGVEFRRHAIGKTIANVSFQVVEESPNTGEDDLATTYHYGGGDRPTAQVLMEANRYGNLFVVNHEAAHAFFFAEHAAEGIMAPHIAAATTWPTEDDLYSLAAWLGTTVGVDGAGVPQPVLAHCEKMHLVIDQYRMDCNPVPFMCFIASVLGRRFEDAMQPEWNQVRADHVPRRKLVDLGGCSVCIQLVWEVDGPCVVNLSAGEECV